MAVGDPILSGDDAAITVFKGGAKLCQDLLVKATIKPVVKEYQDKHLNAKTYRGAVRRRGWTVSLQYEYYDDSLIQAVLAYYQAIDTPGIVQPTWSVVVAVQQHNAAASQPGYKFSPFYPVLDLDVAGQDERIKQGLEGFAEAWTPFVPLVAG